MDPKEAESKEAESKEAESKEAAAAAPELKACDFREVIEIKKAGHFEGTREWVFDTVRKWLRTDQRLFWLAGGAGTGKSVVSAKLFDAEEVKECIVAWHFCRHNYAAENRLRVILESLAAMLKAHLPGFEVQDVSAALSGSTEEMFENLIARPLKRLAPPSRPALILLDALDEVPQECLRPVLELLTGAFQQLPTFVRVFITSRDEAMIKVHLQQFEHLELKVDELRNREDLRGFLVQVAQRCVKLELSTADMEAKLENEFGLPHLSLHNKLAALADPIRKSKHTYDVARSKFRQQPEYQKICGIKEISSQNNMQLESDVNALYEDAGMARDKLLNIFASEWEVHKVIGGTVLKIPVAGKAAPFVDRVIDPGLKTLASALRKMKDDYEDDARRLKDLARLTAESKDCGRMSEILHVFESHPDIDVLTRRNKYANPSSLGYSDFNLCIRVRLENGRTHLCEIQVNLEDMLVAKDMAHGYYETMREALPQICRDAGIAKDQTSKFEASVMRMLKTSVLDSVVHELELKAGGLFLYASLVANQLKEEKELIDISKLLKGLPNGLGDIYKTNFARMGQWEKHKRVIGLIAAAREPLLASLVQEIVGASFPELVAALSVLFPVRDERFEVVHKTVVDWLQDPSRAQQEYSLTPDDLRLAHRELGTQFLRRVHHCLRSPQFQSETLTVSPEDAFAIRYTVDHLCEAGMLQEAQQLVLNFDWLLTRAALRDYVALIADVERVAERTASATVRLVGSALTLALPSLQEDWRYLPAQLAGRLIGSEESDEVKVFLERVRQWPGPSVGRKWWCPISQTLEPAGGDLLLHFAQSSGVRTAEWSSDGKYISTGDDNQIRIWNAKTGKTIQTLTGHTNAVRCVAWSTDHRICSGSWDRTVRVWNVESGECVKILNGHSETVNSVAWSLDGKMLCSGSPDKTVRVWDSESGDCVQTLTGHTEGVTCVAWRHDGTVCSGSRDNNVRVWDPKSGECLLTLTGHRGEVYSVACNADGRVCSTGLDRTVRVWSASGETLREMYGHIRDICSVAWTKDGNDGRVVSASLDRTVRIWDVSAGRCVKTLTGHLGEVYTVACSNGKMASGSDDMTVRVWDVGGGESVQILAGHTDKVNCVAWYGEHRVCTGSNDGTARVWDVKTGKCLATLRITIGAMVSVAWSGDGRLCTGSQDAVRVWNVISETCKVLPLTGYTAGVETVAWSTDGKVCCRGRGGATRIWDPLTGQHLPNHRFVPWGLGATGKFRYQRDTDPLPIMPRMWISTGPIDATRAIAQSSSSSREVYILRLLGGVYTAPPPPPPPVVIAPVKEPQSQQLEKGGSASSKEAEVAPLAANQAKEEAKLAEVDLANSPKEEGASSNKAENNQPPKIEENPNKNENKPVPAEVSNNPKNLQTEEKVNKEENKPLEANLKIEENPNKEENKPVEAPKTEGNVKEENKPVEANLKSEGASLKKKENLWNVWLNLKA